MASIQSLGVGSGLDVRSIISQLMSIERQPLQRMQEAAKGVQTQLSLYGQLQSKIDALGTAAQALSSVNRWRETRVDQGGTEAFSVTTSGSVEPIGLDIEIRALAQRQSVTTRTFDSPSATVGTGTLSIQIGQWSTDFGTFSPDPDISSVDVVIDANASSLAGIREAINGANAGVRADILTDGQGSRLVMRSTATGQTKGFAITASNATNEFGALSFGAQTSPASSSGAQGQVRASDLEVGINGAVVRSSGNTLDNVLPGISITARQTTSSPHPVRIEADLEGIKTRIQTFVTAYNDVMAFLKTQTAYNESARTRGPLQGDRTTLTIQNTLRQATTDASNASSLFSRLSDIGITLQRGGALSVDTAKLDDALQNLEDVAALFSADAPASADDGFAQRMVETVGTMNADEGYLSTQRSSLQARLQRGQDEQERMEDRLVLVEARLKAQYTALDGKMADINGLAQFVGRQFSTSTAG